MNAIERTTGLDVFQKIVNLTVANGSASEKTVKLYSANLFRFFDWCAEGDLSPLGLSVENLQEYRSDLCSRMSHATVKLRLRVVRLFYDALQRYGRRTDNPAIGLLAPRKPTPTEQEIMGKALSPDEARKFLSFIPDSKSLNDQSTRDRALLLLMILQGLRIQEVSNLLLGDVDTSFSKLKVHGKGGKVRYLLLSEPVREALINLVGSHRNASNLPLFNRFDVPFGVIKRLSTRSIERIADKYLIKAGLKMRGRGAHALRHTYATMSVLGGAHREALGQSMGHSSLATTDIYIRASAQYQDNPAVKALEFLQNQKTVEDQVPVSASES